MIAFKVLRKDLTSLGLRAAKHNRVQYKIGRWIIPKEAISKDGEGGGLYVAPSLSEAKKLKSYFEKNHGVRAKIFLCEIGRVLKRPSECRIKTDKVKLLREIRTQVRRG